MTVDEIKAKLSAIDDARATCLAGKSYSIDGVSYTRQDLSALDELYTYWAGRLIAKTKGSPSSVNFRPAICIDRGGGRCR